MIDCGWILIWSLMYFLNPVTVGLSYVSSANYPGGQALRLLHSQPNLRVRWTVPTHLTTQSIGKLREQCQLPLGSSTADLTLTTQAQGKLPEQCQLPLRSSTADPPLTTQSQGKLREQCQIPWGQELRILHSQPNLRVSYVISANTTGGQFLWFLNWSPTE